MDCERHWGSARGKADIIASIPLPALAEPFPFEHLGASGRIAAERVAYCVAGSGACRALAFAFARRMERDVVDACASISTRRRSRSRGLQPTV
jgi:hypothetical protein